MNRLLVSVAALAVLCVAGAAQAAGLSLTHGQVISRTAGKVTLHDYVTTTGGAAQVVESDRLVVFDVPGNAPQNNEFKAFVDSLGKPVEAVIISHGHEHHWLGADTLFPGVKIYSTDADSINGEQGKRLWRARVPPWGRKWCPILQFLLLSSLRPDRRVWPV